MDDKKNDNENNLYKNKYDDTDLFSYYDIIFYIDSLENLKRNGWKIESTERGLYKYNNKKDKKCTLVSVLGNKNTGKSFILSKISNFEIPDGFNISTKGLSIIYPEYEEKNIIFLDTLGLEDPLCEDDEYFKFTTNNEQYLKLNENIKKSISIKDYLTEYEYIEQILKFIRDKQLTNEFIKKFVIYHSNINIYVVDSELDLKDQNFYKYFLEDKINIIIHNLKTFREKREVEDYINYYLLKSVPFKLIKNIFTIYENEKGNNNNKNKYYYNQILREDKNLTIIHLIMANNSSEAGSYYNESTINFIRKKIETNFDFVKFPILEKVREFLFEHSEEFFNDPLKNIEDLILTREYGEPGLLKYIGVPYELLNCYIDKIEDLHFIHSNYKPNYRVYKVKYKDENGESIKLIIDIEISGEVDIKEIENPVIDNNDKQNIITISGNRNLKKKKKKNENDNIDEKKPKYYYISEYKSSYFDDENRLFNLRIYIPKEKCIIETLYKRIFYVDKGLYRFIYNIKEKNDTVSNVGVIIDSDDDDEYDDEN